MTNKTKKFNPRKRYWVAFAIYTFAAVILALIDGSGDTDRHMQFLMIFFIAYNVFDSRIDIMEIKQKLEHKPDTMNPEAIDANYNPVE